MDWSYGWVIENGGGCRGNCLELEILGTFLAADIAGAGAANMPLSATLVTSLQLLMRRGVHSKHAIKLIPIITYLGIEARRKRKVAYCGILRRHNCFPADEASVQLERYS
jgi:hypothetical protein